MLQYNVQTEQIIRIKGKHVNQFTLSNLVLLLLKKLVFRLKPLCLPATDIYIDSSRLQDKRLVRHVHRILYAMCHQHVQYRLKMMSLL